MDITVYVSLAETLKPEQKIGNINAYILLKEMI